MSPEIPLDPYRQPITDPARLDPTVAWRPSKLLPASEIVMSIGELASEVIERQDSATLAQAGYEWRLRDRLHLAGDVSRKGRAPYQGQFVPGREESPFTTYREFCEQFSIEKGHRRIHVVIHRDAAQIAAEEEEERMLAELDQRDDEGFNAIHDIEFSDPDGPASPASIPPQPRSSMRQRLSPLILEIPQALYRSRFQFRLSMRLRWFQAGGRIH
ncbi:hypothetical protein N7535_008337 [Penicillium sp. DV-2018c]|nr:hypothetical protein N7461_002096 [Penicillium sp. DV-2018c]KAJ5563173.1 hypothetical protein N7535_008337 [Penicillium sp. DV-2018c]